MESAILRVKAFIVRFESPLSLTKYIKADVRLPIITIKKIITTYFISFASWQNLKLIHN